MSIIYCHYNNEHVIIQSKILYNGSVVVTSGFLDYSPLTTVNGL